MVLCCQSNGRKKKGHIYAYLQIEAGKRVLDSRRVLCHIFGDNRDNGCGQSDVSSHSSQEEGEKGDCIEV